MNSEDDAGEGAEELCTERTVGGGTEADADEVAAESCTEGEEEEAGECADLPKVEGPG